MNWFCLLILVGGPLVILIDCMAFLSLLLDVMGMPVYANKIFPRTARFWIFLPAKCFPFSEVNKHLLSFSSF